jgi:succinoglycan biosynthesis transport protein ExoP
LPAIERELQLREADVDVANATYGTVAKELKDAEIRSNPMPEARLISPAFVPPLPSHPRRSIIVLAAFLAGLLVGVALAFFLEYINRTVRRINDIEDFVGLKVVGTIPLVMPLKFRLGQTSD